MLGRCKLCGSQGELELSHIIPSFVFKWQKKGGHIRHTENINRRIQDGEKDYLLCRDCEERLSTWERYFANNVFHPINADARHVAKYSDWMLKFCASISWRTLTHITKHGRLNHLSDRQLIESEIALTTWRKVILDEIPHPGRYEQHILPLDMIDSTGGFAFPPNINRYFMHAVEMDVAAGKKSAFVYSKLGRFAIFGFIEVLKPREWNSTKTHIKDGFVNSKTYTLPYSVGDYLAHRAAKAWEKMNSMSEMQQRVIALTIESNPNRFINSETFKAIQQDVTLFGHRAFSRKT